jgi:hypothetical protein
VREEEVNAGCSQKDSIKKSISVSHLVEPEIFKLLKATAVKLLVWGTLLSLLFTPESCHELQASHLDFSLFFLFLLRFTLHFFSQDSSSLLSVWHDSWMKSVKHHREAQQS